MGLCANVVPGCYGALGHAFGVECGLGELFCIISSIVNRGIVVCNNLNRKARRWDGPRAQ